MTEPAASSESPVPAARLVWSAHTDKGRFRPNNEDAFLALTFDAHEVSYLGKVGAGQLAERDYVFAVSDGMGGAKSGEFASRVATQAIMRQLPRHFRAQGARAHEALEKLCLTIHAEMLTHSRSYEDCRGMGATLTLCWFQPGLAHFAHIGDSRLYHLPQGAAMKQLSRDDTHVGWMFRQGQINEREQRSHPRRSILDQVLGAKQQNLTPQIESVAWAPGDRFLLCSDGIVDGLWDQALARHLGKPELPETFGAWLVREAIDEGSKDNATALVVWAEEA